MPNQRDPVPHQWYSYRRAVPVMEGVAVISVIAPLERIKILMQVSSASKTITAAGGYRGMMQSFSQCCYEQGYRSLWRGFSATLIVQLPTFFLHKQFGYWFETTFDRREHRRFFQARAASGAASSAVVLALFYPLDFLRTRLAADIGRTRSEREFTSLWNCGKTIVKQDGVRGLYRGFFISVQGLVLYRAAYFGLFDTWTAMISPKNKNFVTSWLAGQSLAVFCGLLTFPLDLLHRQMQMQSGSNHLVYEGAIQAIRKTAAKEGIRGFYRGLLPTLLAGSLTSTLYVMLSFKDARPS